MKKKIIAIGLILSLMATPILSGCSNSDTSQETVAPTEVTTDAPAEEELDIVYFEERGNIPKPDSLNTDVVYDKKDYDGYRYDLNFVDYDTAESFYMLYCKAIDASGYTLYGYLSDELFDEYDMEYMYDVYYSTKLVARIELEYITEETRYQMCVKFFEN